LTAAPTADTYVFEITYLGADPDEAAAVANTAAEAFAERSREASQLEARGAREVVEEQLEVAAHELEAARRTLWEFTEQNDVAAFEEGLSARVRILADLESALEINHKELRGAEAEIDEIERQLDQQSEFLKSSSKYTNNPLVTELKSDLARLEIELTGLLESFTPSHPEVVSLEARILETRSKLDQEAARILSDEETTTNSVYLELTSALALAHAKLESLREQEKSLIEAVAKRKLDLRDFASREPELDRLDTGPETETYRFIRQAFEEARLREAEKIAEIRVVSPAIPPTNPSEPIKVLFAGAALAGSLILGVGLALFLEYINLKIRNVEEAERALALPVLATIPEMDLTSRSLHTYADQSNPERT
jgi:uncharacterized protein involved in exopolysaccharide biosynthesis